MEGQTSLLLEALGHPDRLAVVLRLLETEARERDLVRELGLAQKTANRHFAQLRDVGIVTRDTPHGPNRLTLERETREALEAIHSLATRLLEQRLAVEREVGQRLRKSRLKPSPEAHASEPGA